MTAYERQIRMPVLAELWMALLLGFLAVELDAASRRVLRTTGRVTDWVVLLDFSLGLTAVLVTVLCSRIAVELLF